MVLVWCDVFRVLDDLEGDCLDAANFGTKCVGRAFQGLGDGLLSEDLVLQIILTGVAIALAGNAIEPTRKALAVELEAATVAAVAASEALRWGLQGLVGVLRRVIAHVKICLYLFVILTYAGNERRVSTNSGVRGLLSTQSWGSARGNGASQNVGWSLGVL